MELFSFTNWLKNMRSSRHGTRRNKRRAAAGLQSLTGYSDAAFATTSVDTSYQHLR